MLSSLFPGNFFLVNFCGTIGGEQETRRETTMADAANDPPGRDDETARLSAHVLALLARVTERFDSEEHEEWQWLTRHSNSSLIVDLLRDSTPTALRVLDAIGRLEPVNGITVAEHARLRRGTVSKITRRLVASDLITQA